MFQVPTGVRCTALEARSLPPGTRVQIRGQLRSLAPLRGPFSRARVLGYHVALSLRGPGFQSRRDLVAWRDAVLSDGTGLLPVHLRGVPVRAPVLASHELHDEEVGRALERLGVERREGEGEADTLEFLERAIEDSARVTVFGVLAAVETPQAGAFRANARPQVVLTGDRGQPVLLLPGAA